MNAEDTTKAVELITKAGSIGLFLPERPDFDTLASAQVLAAVLAAQGKTTGLLTPATATDEEQKKIFSKILGAALPLKEFIISVNTRDTAISQLRYEKHEDRVDIILTPKSSPIQAHAISFREGAVQSDCLMMIGIPRIEHIANMKDFAPDFFTEHAVINIDNDAVNAQYGEANCCDSERPSRSELVWQILAAEPLWTPDAASATLLLAGILSASSSFTDPRTSAETLQIAADLMRAGAMHEDARVLIQESRPLNLLQLASRASVRSKFDGERGILWSFLTAEDFIKTSRTADDVPLVLASLERMLPKPATHILLWQESGEAPVQAIISAAPPVREELQKQEYGEMMSPYLKLGRVFPSFRSAEEHIGALIQKVL